MVRILAIFAFVLSASARALAAPTPDLPPQPAVHPAGIPANAVLLSPCIAGMGEHWGAVTDMPVGPLYGVWQGKPVFTELMIPLTQLEKGFSWANLRALPGYTIDHVDVKFEPNGHHGLPVPHYDVHAYYVSPQAQAAICPGGLPDPSMKASNG